MVFFAWVIAYTQPDSVDIYSYNLIELSKLTVNSVSKVPQEYREVSSTISIITAREIRENGYITFDQVLANLPGFQFRNTQGFNSYVFQRGVPSQNNLILILIDGIQVNELNSGGFYSGGQYNLENVERIVVIYGPASVLYGTNAVSGVINIITKDNQGLSASLLTGNFNTFNSNLNYGFKKEDFSLSVSGMYKTTEKANLAGTAGDNNWSEQMENFEDDYAFDAKIRYKNFTAGINFMNKQASRTTNYKSAGTVYQDYGTLWNIMFTNAYLKLRHKFSDNLSYLVNIYNRNATVRDNTIAMITDTAQVGYYRPNNLLGVENILIYKLNDKFDMAGGIMFEIENIASGFSETYSNSANTPPAIPSKPFMLQNNLLSVFFEAEYDIIPQLSLDCGVRFDNSSVYDQVITPKASLIFNSNKISSKIIYAEAFRAPKPWDYTSGLSNPDLLPERLVTFEFSNSVYFTERFVMSLSVYKNFLNDAIIKEPNPTGSYRWVNKGRFETDGAEVIAKYSTKKLSLFANYTYNSTYDDEKVQIPEIAKHSANTGFTYRYLDYFRLSINANYLGSRKNLKIITATGSDFIDPVVVFNGSFLFVRLKDIDFQITMNNIFNTEYYHTSNRPPERYRQPQRAIMLKLSYNFDADE